MSLYVQGLPTEHHVRWYVAALDVKYRLIRFDLAPPCKQRKHVQPTDLQHFGYQSSSSTRDRPGSLVEVAMERCLAGCSQFVGDRSPGPADVAAGLKSDHGRR